MLETPPRSQTIPEFAAPPSNSPTGGNAQKALYFADKLFLRRLDLWFALILIALCTLNLAVISLPYYRAAISMVDESWRLEMVARATHGTWLGRDVVFTYGPLFQWLSNLAPKVTGHTLGAMFVDIPLFPFVASILLVYGIGALLLRRQPMWKRCLFLLLIVLFWSPSDVRPEFALFCFAVSVWAFETCGTSLRRVMPSAFICSTLMIVGFLISADCGFYSLAAFSLAAFAHFFSGRQPQVSWLAGFAVLFLVVGMLLVNIWAGRIADFSYWRSALEVTNHYRWSLAYQMEKANAYRMWIGVGCGIAVLIWAYITRDKQSSAANSLLAATGFSFLYLQSAMVRSDWGHVVIGLFPLVAVCCAALLGFAKPATNHGEPFYPVLVALVLTGIFSGPNLIYSPLLTAQRFKHYGGRPRCPDNSYFFSNACLQSIDFYRLESVSRQVRDNVPPGEKVLIYPYENIYGFTSDRAVAGGVLQNYVVAGDYLTKRQLQGLERDSAPIAIYSADGLASWPVDGVANFTRTPAIWMYVQRWYEKLATAENGVLVLRRNDSRGHRWRATTIPLKMQTGQFPVVKYRELELGEVSDWPSGPIDFLKLKLKVRYPFWWKFRKPSSFVVRLRMSDGSEKSMPVVLEPNRSTEIWMYPANESNLLKYFAPAEGGWRKPEPLPKVIGISLRISRMDWVSVLPSSVIIEELSGVRLALD